MKTDVATVTATSRLLVTAFCVAFCVGSLCAADPPKTTDPPKTPAEYDVLIQDADRQHWAFQPVERIAIPPVKDASWPRNPIDNFVLARLEQSGWRPAANVSDAKWLRRVCLDVTGLPPSLALQKEFLADQSAVKREKLIDRLLADPGYGERWARHWLDLVRFAETNGYERDAQKPSVWRYRDWVISALNRDLPYDRFVIEQLAGDELDDADADTVTAAGFLRLGHWDDEPADFDQDRFDQLDDILDTTSQAFLGLTLACARCHNHKFEPLTALDYYRVIAVFNPLVRPQNGRTELDLPAIPPKQRVELAARDRALGDIARQKDQLWTVFRNEFLKSGNSKLAPEIVAVLQTDDAKRTPEQKELANKHKQALEKEAGAAIPDELRQKFTDLDKQSAELKAKLPDPPRAYCMHELSPKAPVSHLLLRGQASSPGLEVQPGVPAVLVPKQPEFLPPGEFSTRRRLTMARWIASPNNPLTARVIVNRVWQFHFGEGLVRSPSDFGYMGASPSHPELLAWLAHWFVHDAKWSLKELHRLILSSRTYAMSTAVNPEYQAEDPENLLLWRFPHRRLSAEAMHDSMLAASGQLYRTMGGPSVHMYVPKEALEGNSDPDKIWPPFDEVQGSRRAVYAYVKRGLVVPLLDVLDLCDTTRSADRRNVTHVAPQALTLMNGDFVNRQARYLADRLLREAPENEPRQIELAFRLAVCRPPESEELVLVKSFLRYQRDDLAREAHVAGGGTTGSADGAKIRRAALVQLGRVIFNWNEFAYPD